MDLFLSQSYRIGAYQQKCDALWQCDDRALAARQQKEKVAKRQSVHFSPLVEYSSSPAEAANESLLQNSQPVTSVFEGVPSQQQELLSP